MRDHSPRSCIAATHSRSQDTRRRTRGSCSRCRAVSRSRSSRSRRSRPIPDRMRGRKRRPRTHAANALAAGRWPSHMRRSDRRRSTTPRSCRRIAFHWRHTLPCTCRANKPHPYNSCRTRRSSRPMSRRLLRIRWRRRDRNLRSATRRCWCTEARIVRWCRPTSTAVRGRSDCRKRRNWPPNREMSRIRCRAFRRSCRSPARIACRTVRRRTLPRCAHRPRCSACCMRRNGRSNRVRFRIRSTCRRRSRRSLAHMATDKAPRRTSASRSAGSGRHDRTRRSGRDPRRAVRSDCRT